MTQKENIILSEIFNSVSPIKIIDIGAFMYDDMPPNYQILIDNNIAEVIGFEPNKNALLKLQEHFKGYTYLPYAIGDGMESIFYSTEMPTCSSLLKPNLFILKDFHHFPEWLKIKEEFKIKTHRLDDVLKDYDADYIKLDIQGGELTALQNGINILSKSIIVEVEVEFIQQYENQPLFAEIELFMRKNGFMFHTFLGYGTRSIKPIIKNNMSRGFRQWIWSDAVFIKNLWLDHGLSEQKLLKMAIILHDLYQSYDFAYFALKQCDLKFSTNYSVHYREKLEFYMRRTA